MRPRQQPQAKRSKKALAIAGSLALVLTGVIATYFLTPSQEVRNQNAVQQDHDSQDVHSESVRLENAEYDVLTHSQTFPKATSNEVLQQAIEGTGKFPENAIAVGQDLRGGRTVEYFRRAEEIHFTLVGNHYRPVLVKSTRIISRDKPLTGTVLYQLGQGRSEVPQIGFDLDSSDLAARNLNADLTPSKKHYLDEVQLTLARDEPLEFHASVYTTSCSCKFVFDITFLDGTTQTIDYNGKPWHVSAFATQYQRAYFTDLSGPLAKVKPCTWPVGCQSYPQY